MDGNTWYIFILVLSMSQVIMVLLTTGAATAASMAELGKNGNLHARWNPICNKFGSFCNRGGVSLVSSFVGVALMLALNLLSAVANSPRAVVAGQWTLVPQLRQLTPKSTLLMSLGCEVMWANMVACGSWISGGSVLKAASVLNLVYNCISPCLVWNV